MRYVYKKTPVAPDSEGQVFYLMTEESGKTLPIWFFNVT